MEPALHTKGHLLRRWGVFPVVTLLFFIIGLMAFFPGDAVRIRLQQELAAAVKKPVELGKTTLSLPLQLHTTTLAIDPLGPVPFSAEDLTVSPAWTSLFSTTPAAELSATALGGQMHATLNLAGELDFSAQALHWQGGLPDLPSLTLQAALREINLTGTVANAFQLNQLRATLDSLSLSGLSKLGAATDSLVLGEVFVQLHQEGQQLMIDQLENRGGDLTIQASGTVSVGPTPQRTRLALDIKLIPQPSSDPGLLSLLQLVSPADQNGHFSLQIKGTLAQPSIH